MTTPANEPQENKTTLWIGDVEKWMNEMVLKELFQESGEVRSVKIIRDKETKLPVGYGFVEFESHEVASQVLDRFSGKLNPKTNKPFRLNWGVHGASRNKQMNNPLGGYNSRGGSWGDRKKMYNDHNISVSPKLPQNTVILPSTY